MRPKNLKIKPYFALSTNQYSLPTKGMVAA